MSVIRFSAVAPLILFTLFLPSAFGEPMSMPGDINGDGKTNHVDFFLYALTFDPRGRQAASPAEDLNQDFEVDQNDLYLAILGRLHGENGLPPIDLDQTGVLEGQVLEDVGDAAVVIPVPEAEVFILASTGHRFRIRTNEQGVFRADGIPAGPVSVRVKHPDYHPGYARAQVGVNEAEEVTIHLMPRRDDLASIRGKVEGAADPFVDFQEPLAGAVVRVMPIHNGEVIGDNNAGHFPGESDPHQVAFTNDQGFYEIHDLPPGDYRMVVSAHGYEAERREIVVEGNTSQVQDFLLFEVQREGGSLHGTVYSMGEASADIKGIEPDTEHPLAGAHVLLERYWEDETDPFDPTLPPSDQPIVFPHPIYETRTDNQGQYRLDGVSPGKYRVHVSARGHFPSDATIEIEAGDDIEKDFRLAPIVIEYGAVAGTVFGVTPENNLETPLADALVTLVPRHDFTFPPEMKGMAPDTPASFVQSATTDDDGHYEFNRVPVGLYDLHASARGWGRTTDAAEVVKDETTEVDLVIVHTPRPGPSTLEGTVWLQPEGAITVLEPASGAEVVAIPADPDWTDMEWFPPGDPNGSVPPYHPFPEPLVTRTDSEGHYRFDRLRAGKYHVIASYPDYHSEEEIVGIPPESDVTQDFTLSPIRTGPGQVLGRVTFSPPSMASEPQPIAGAKVVLIGQNDIPIPLPIIPPDVLAGAPILPPDFFYETETNDDGYFEFPEVRPGHYIAHVSADEFQSARQEVWVPAGETVTLHFDLIPDMGGGGGVTLEGGVWEAGANGSSTDFRIPIPGATVVAIPLCPNCDPAIGPVGPDGQYSPPRITETNERGRYRFDNLPPGYTAVTVIAEGYLPAIQFKNLPEGRVTVLNFWLDPVGGGDRTGLFGQITQWTPYPTFAPVPVEGAKISLEPLFPLPLPPTGPIPYTLEAESDERGNYRFVDLEPGPYSMDVHADGFRAVEDLEVNVHPGEKTRQDVLLYPIDQGSAVYRGHVYELEGDVPPDDAKLVLTPIEGATVRLVPDWMVVPAIFPPPNVGFDRITNEQGEFSFDSLPAGGYGVTVLEDGYEPQSGHIELDDNQILDEDWFLDRDKRMAGLFGTITEWVNDPNIAELAPVEGALVVLDPPYPTTLGPEYFETFTTETDEMGNYRFPELLPGQYGMSVHAEGYASVEGLEVHLPPGQDVRQDVILFSNGEGNASYQGHVFESDHADEVGDDKGIEEEPIEGAIVRLIPDGFPIIEIFPPPSLGLDRITNENGEFSFEGIPAGGYMVTVLAEGYAPIGGHIELVDGEVLEEDWFLDPLPDDRIQVRGRVREDTGELDVWIPIEGATLGLTRILDDGSSPPYGIGGNYVESGPEGDFEFPPVNPGLYRLRVESPGYEAYEELLELGNEKESFVLVELKKAMELDAANAK